MSLIEPQKETAGFFGKLPKFADFVKMNSSINEIMILDNWIQEGLATAKLKFKNEWKSFYESSGTLNFIFPFTDSDKIISGIIKPSRDKSGRQFPFLFFVILNRKRLNGIPAHLITFKLQDTFTSMNKIVQHNFENEILDELKSAVSNFTLPQDFQDSTMDGYRQHLDFNSVESILKTNSTTSSEYEEISLNDLINKNLHYLENSEGLSFSFTSDPESKFLNLSFVTQMLLNVFSKYSSIPALFWKNVKTEKIILFLFFQKPLPSDFCELIYNGYSNQETDERQEAKILHKLINSSEMIKASDSLQNLLTIIKSANK